MVCHIHGVGSGRSWEGGVDFIGRFTAARSTAAHHRDLRTFGSKRTGDFLTDSAATSGDDSDFIGKT